MRDQTSTVCSWTDSGSLGTSVDSPGQELLSAAITVDTDGSKKENTAKPAISMGSVWSMDTLPLPPITVWIPEENSALDQTGMKAAVASEVGPGGRLSGENVGSVVAADMGRGIVSVGPMTDVGKEKEIGMVDV